MAVITASPSNFQRLLELQKLSIDHLEAINKNIAESLVYERLQALEQLAIARETDKQEDETSRIEGILNNILDVIKSNVAAISTTNITTNQQQSSTFVSKNSSNNSTAVVTQDEESKKEADAKQDKVISFLEKIEKNTRNPIITAGKPAEEGGGIGLGGIATAIAVALGAVVAAIKAQVKAIKYFLDLLVPDKLTAALSKRIASFVAGLSMRFDIITISIGEKLAAITKIFDNVIDWVKGLFGGVKESKLGEVVGRFFSFVGKALDPFIDAGKLIAGFIEGPIGKAVNYVQETFGAVAKWFGEFGTKVGKIAVVLEKFMLPLTIIMTVWDTVKGAIEGFEKEGFVGGIKGAITGFFNSLIFGPIDMLKDAAAWVAGFFGFDKAKEALESFNLSDIFKQLVDIVFSPIETFKKIVGKIGEMFDKLKDITIPEFGFKIPFTDKKVSIGPFQPFKSMGGSTEATPAASAGTQSTTQTPVAAAVAPAAPSTAAEVTQRSSNITSMKEDAAKSGNMSAVVAPTVSNNVSNTQVATLRAPVRSADPSFDRYISTRVVV